MQTAIDYSFLMSPVPFCHTMLGDASPYYKFAAWIYSLHGFKVSSIVDPEQFAYYAVKPDHSNYNLRVHAFTVNDNLDMYTRRGDDGGGRPDTTNYHLTSVRESVPWAIDEDEYDLGAALDANTDPFITKVIAGSFIVALAALLVVGVVVPSITDYGDGVCSPIQNGGRC